MHDLAASIRTDLVLLGGGHSHLFVLRHLGMHSQPGLRVTLVARDLHTAYSGMLPGLIAGHYDFDDAHIDLQPLARFAGVRVVHANAISIDAGRQQIGFRERPPLEYDLLSINIGSRPASGASPAGRDEIAVKPVDEFLRSWNEIESCLTSAETPLRLAIVGAGAGGVELALSIAWRAERLGPAGAGLRLALYTDRAEVLPTHNARTRRYFTEVLRQRSIELHCNFRVDRFDSGQLLDLDGNRSEADRVIWATQATAPGWLRDSGLALDEQGFVAVDASLQSLSHGNVFAAGDIASVDAYPRPRSGVFAVRQGQPLARNLLRRARGEPALPFKPQRQYLSLISTGDRNAAASRGRWFFAGRWCWWLKDRIDRRFVRRFSELPAMDGAAPDGEEIAPMRCGGCGAKVGSQVLERVLARIAEEHGAGVVAPTAEADDAALIDVPPGTQLVQTVDHLRSFIDDPYRFGQIAAVHALGDLHAMGVDADSALVSAVLVYASEERQAEDLYQLMSGVVEVLARHDTRLVGGHSGEASQMSCGLSLNGFAAPGTTLRKAGMRPGEVMILCKPLGSGVLFAADMRGLARGDWIDAALEVMLQSSRDAAACLRRHGASACTDVTGFGLAGHLFEMARASGCAAAIRLDRLPVYAGAAELVRRGIESSLQPQNRRLRHRILDPDGLDAHPNYPLLFDPQTAGGLLASLPADAAAACLEALHELGYRDARVIATALPQESPDWSLSLVSS